MRRLKVRPALTSLRKELVRWNNKTTALSRSEIEQLLLHPQEIAKFDPAALRRVVAYVLLRWLDDYTADLRGEYFPFDLPNLAFYRRGIQLGQLVGELVAHPDYEHKRADQATILKYLEKYEHQLVGHVIEREGQEPFIVCRMNNPAEQLILDGNLANLPAAIAAHWPAAQVIRQQRQTPPTEYPIPTTKKQIRDPSLLKTIKTIAKNLINLLKELAHAA